MDRPDHREAGVRPAGQPLRLRQEGQWILLLVPWHRSSQEGLPGRGRPLVTWPVRLPIVPPDLKKNKKQM